VAALAPLVVFSMPPHTTALLILTHDDAVDPHTECRSTMGYRSQDRICSLQGLLSGDAWLLPALDAL
jgi:hypothetical protein